MSRPRNPEPPTLPVIVLARVPVATPTTMRTAPTMEAFDVVARVNGNEIRRWPWWHADKPRRRNAKYLRLDGVRYAVEFA